MAYLYRQKINLLELAPAKLQPKTVLLAEPEEYLLALYSGYLHNSNFKVHHCDQVELLEDMIIRHSPHILILSVHFFEQPAENLHLLRRLKHNYPSLPIVTVGYKLNSDHLRQFMSAGIDSYIERMLTRPKDIIMVINTIFNL